VPEANPRNCVAYSCTWYCFNNTCVCILLHVIHMQSLHMHGSTLAQPSSVFSSHTVNFTIGLV
jgi:hypothetical protein